MLIIMNKCLSFMLIASSFSLGTLQSWGQSNPVAKVDFHCEYDKGIPTTFVRNSKGYLQPLFLWRQNNLPAHEIDNKETCNRVTNELNNYFQSINNNPSNIRLTYSNVEFAGNSVVCIPAKNGYCDLILLLVPPNLPGNFDGTRNFLEAILDKTLQTKWREDTYRGVLLVDIKLLNKNQN